MQSFSEAEAIISSETQDGALRSFARTFVQCAMSLYALERGLCGAMVLCEAQRGSGRASSRPGNVLPARRYGRRRPSVK
jgi:hypothetical protein